MGADQLAEIVQHLDYAELVLKNGDPTAALTGIDEVLRADHPELSPALVRRARRLRASASEGVGDYPAAIAQLEALATDAPRDEEWIGMLLALNRCYRDSGDIAGAMESGRQALAEIERNGLDDTEEIIRFTVTVAGAHLVAGDLNYALRMCERAAERAEAIGSDVGRASAYWNAAGARFQMGEIPAAVELTRRALLAFEKAGRTREQGMLHTNLAVYYARLSPAELDAAEFHAVRAVELHVWSDASPVEKAEVDYAIAEIAYRRGDLERARAAAGEALRATEHSAPSLAGLSCILLGQVALAADDPAEARSCVERAVLLLASCGQDHQIAWAWYQLGALLAEVGDTEGAIDAYRRAAVSRGMVIAEPTLHEQSRRPGRARAWPTG